MKTYVSRSRVAAFVALAGAASMFCVAHASTSQTDEKYLKEDAQGSVYDAATAGLAAQKATSPALHNYALRLIADHARLNQILFTLAYKKRLQLPVMLADDDAARLTRYSRLQGRRFDQEIVKEFVRINGDDVKAGQQELRATRDPAVRRAVTQFVRTEQKHLNGARALMRSMR